MPFVLYILKLKRNSAELKRYRIFPDPIDSHAVTYRSTWNPVLGVIKCLYNGYSLLSLCYGVGRHFPHKLMERCISVARFFFTWVYKYLQINNLQVNTVTTGYCSDTTELLHTGTPVTVSFDLYTPFFEFSTLC